MNSSVSKPVKLSLPNIVTVLTCAVAVAVSWGTLDAQVSELNQKVATLEERTLVQLESLNVGMNNLRVELAKVSNDLEWMKAQMKEN